MFKNLRELKRCCIFDVSNNNNNIKPNIMKDVRDILRDALTELTRYGTILKDNHHWDIRKQVIEYQDIKYSIHIQRGEVIKIETM